MGTKVLPRDLSERIDGVAAVRVQNMFEQHGHLLIVDWTSAEPLLGRRRVDLLRAIGAIVF